MDPCCDSSAGTKIHVIGMSSDHQNLHFVRLLRVSIFSVKFISLSQQILLP
jgi:hypothetical protein